MYGFRKCDWDKLREALSYAPRYVISTFDDIVDHWEMFHSLLLDSLNAFSPLHKVSPTVGLKGLLDSLLTILLLR